MRAYVMARKGILASNPDVRSMSKAQWLFEYAALRKKENADFDNSFKMLKTVLVSTLGLNLIRPVDENNVPKSYAEMNSEERESFIPLVSWVGRHEMLKVAKEQVDVEKAIEESDEDDSYQKLVDAIDAADGDMEPILGIQPVEPKPVRQDGIPDPSYTDTIKQMVRSDDDVKSIDVDNL